MNLFLRNAYIQFSLPSHLAGFLVICDCHPTEWVPTRCQRMALWYWGSEGSGITGKVIALIISEACYVATPLIHSWGDSDYDTTLLVSPKLMQIHDEDPPELKENDDRTTEVDKVCSIWFHFCNDDEIAYRFACW
jgi:hypothetical protein